MAILRSRPACSTPRIFEWPAHAARLARGLSGIRIPLDASAIDGLRSVCERLVNENGLTDGEATV